jgi:site-specific recombinase XerD
LNLTDSTGRLRVRTSSVEYPKTLRWPDEWYDRIRAWEIFQEADGTLSRSSRELYKGKLENEFLPWVDSTGWSGLLENLTAEHLREYMLYLQRKGLSGATRLVSRGAVRSLWKFLRLDDYIQDDPFEHKGRIPRPKAEDHVVPTLAPLDVARLFKIAERDPYLGRRDVAMLAVLLDTGLRASELCGLMLADVDWREGRLLVRHGKGNKERVVGLGRQAMRALDKYRRWRQERMRQRDWWDEPCDSLFITRGGTPMKSEGLRGRLKTLAGRAGMGRADLWPHLLRHTAATALADAGMSESELRALFGWTRDSGMVERYTRSTTALRALKNQRLNSPLDRLKA